MDIIYMVWLFPVVFKSMVVLGRQQNNGLLISERSADQIPYDSNRLIVDKEQDYVHVGDKPEYSCSVRGKITFLIANPVIWEKSSSDGSRVKISVLANVEKVRCSLKSVSVTEEMGDFMYSRIFCHQVVKNLSSNKTKAADKGQSNQRIVFGRNLGCFKWNN
ncbi:Hypothetical predicted protein [Mytilus galloprovincialis]|uniref:Uncharacterized protein n=1 Tax=Mytilus galloprovincialis TaxID=29158 RepID=A0A8B6HHA8_MYTGA|nr:Hypothetical predicted protein [Mytilus galloprovincialis]